MYEIVKLIFQEIQAAKARNRAPDAAGSQQGAQPKAGGPRQEKRSGIQEIIYHQPNVRFGPIIPCQLPGITDDKTYVEVQHYL